MEKAKRIVIIEIEEPSIEVSSEAKFVHLAEEGQEAEIRYQVLTEVMLAQLVGVKDCHVRFIVSPADGVDAVRFWVLPLLRGEVEVVAGDQQLYRFMPEQHAASVTIDFSLDDGDLSGFDVVARLNMFCLDCGARWLNMAFQQCDLGKKVSGKGYLTATPVSTGAGDGEVFEFPTLAVIEDEAGWERAVVSPIGGKLQKVYERVTGKKLDSE